MSCFQGLPQLAKAFTGEMRGALKITLCSLFIFLNTFHKNNCINLHSESLFVCAQKRNQQTSFVHLISLSQHGFYSSLKHLHAFRWKNKLTYFFITWNGCKSAFTYSLFILTSRLPECWDFISTVPCWHEEYVLDSFLFMLRSFIYQRTSFIGNAQSGINYKETVHSKMKMLSALTSPRVCKFLDEMRERKKSALNDNIFIFKWEEKSSVLANRINKNVWAKCITIKQKMR